MEIRQAISLYLTAKAYNEPEFKEHFEKPNKNLDECVAYITYKMYEKAKGKVTKKVTQSVVEIPSDDEIFALAVQYYLDDDLKVTDFKFMDAKVVSLSATTFTDEEKAKMREEAEKEYKERVIAELKKNNDKKPKVKAPAKPTIVPDVPAKREKENKVATEMSLLFE